MARDLILTTFLCVWLFITIGRLNVLFSQSGQVVNSSIDGCIQMKSYLSGEMSTSVLTVTAAGACRRALCFNSPR